MDNRQISVIVPCFREGQTIYSNLKEINGYLADNFSDYEMIAVADGSPEDTLAGIRQAQAELPKLSLIDNKVNKGKGAAVKDGIMASHFEIVMFLDADLAIPIESVENFVAEIDKGFDMVIASRFVPGLKVVKPVLWYRKLMERIFRILRMIIINNFQVQDTQCGFKMFSRQAAMEIFPLATIERFAFDAEIVYIADHLGYKIKELPISLQNPTVSSIRIWRDSAKMLMDLLRIRKNAFLGKYPRKKRLKKILDKF